MSFRARDWISRRGPAPTQRDEYDYEADAIHRALEDENLGLRARLPKVFARADRLKRRRVTARRVAMCAGCGATFTTEEREQRFCRPHCPGRNRICAGCGRTFAPKRFSQKFCRQSCRERANWLRNHETFNRRRREKWREKNKGGGSESDGP